jgi:hypothetical protein
MQIHRSLRLLVLEDFGWLDLTSCVAILPAIIFKLLKAHKNPRFVVLIHCNIE